MVITTLSVTAYMASLYLKERRAEKKAAEAAREEGAEPAGIAAAEAGAARRETSECVEMGPGVAGQQAKEGEEAAATGPGAAREDGEEEEACRHGLAWWRSLPTTINVRRGSSREQKILRAKPEQR